MLLMAELSLSLPSLILSWAVDEEGESLGSDRWGCTPWQEWGLREVHGWLITPHPVMTGLASLAPVICFAIQCSDLVSCLRPTTWSRRPLLRNWSTLAGVGRRGLTPMRHSSGQRHLCGILQAGLLLVCCVHRPGVQTDLITP